MIGIEDVAGLMGVAVEGAVAIGTLNLVSRMVGGMEQPNRRPRKRTYRTTRKTVKAAPKRRRTTQKRSKKGKRR